MNAERPNILIVLFDTLRYDYFWKSVNDDSNFKKELSDFISFDRAYSPSPWTLPTHFSLFTGMYPSEHHVHEDPNSELEDVFIKARDYNGNFLTRIASENGYSTIAISANPMISSITGFAGKFDKFYEVDEGILSGVRISKRLSNTFLLRAEYYKSRVISTFRGFPKNKGYKIVLSLMDKIFLSNPFFIFLNLMEMHDPYNGKIHTDDNNKILNDFFGIALLSDREIMDLRKTYYDQVEKVKYTIRELIRILKDKGKFENTIFIITSDHGQALKEKGYYGHGVFLYDELIHIPLLIKPPIGHFYDFKKEGYVSLISVHDFLESIIKGKASPKLLYGEHVFSEAFGLQYSKSSLKEYLKEKNKNEIYDRSNVVRKAIMKDGQKLCLNAKSDIEEYYDDSKPSNRIGDMAKINDLLFDLGIFNIDENFVIDNLAIETKKEVEKNGKKI